MTSDSKSGPCPGVGLKGKGQDVIKTDFLIFFHKPTWVSHQCNCSNIDTCNCSNIDTCNCSNIDTCRNIDNCGIIDKCNCSIIDYKISATAATLIL